MKNSNAYSKKSSRYITGVAILALILVVELIGLLGMCLTEVKAKKVEDVSLESIKIANYGMESMELNPLYLDESSEVRDTIEAYYKALADETDYVEYYDNIQVHTKVGQYPDTYVAFVRYDMKIEGIYTMVPGLGTLYIERGEDDQYQVIVPVEDESVRSYINKIAEHEDVQALLEDTRKSYEEALASDALLKEALEDLQKLND